MGCIIQRVAMTFLVLPFGAALSAQTPPAGKGPLDVTAVIEIAELLPPAVEPREDEKTGFVVGGKNPTERLAKLTEINGLSIKQLEKDMRPKSLSAAGFLGAHEKLLEILAADNRYVVDELGLSHQQLARHLHVMGAIGNWQTAHKQEGEAFLYHGKRFTVKVAHSRGKQPSPFGDGTTSGSNATVTNLDSGKKLQYGLLVPYMVERYGFYEGKGTPYRLEPSAVIELLDFLQVKKK